jgi:hypothetical protein
VLSALQATSLVSTTVAVEDAQVARGPRGPALGALGVAGRLEGLPMACA